MLVTRLSCLRSVLRSPALMKSGPAQIRPQQVPNLLSCAAVRLIRASLERCVLMMCCVVSDQGYSTKTRLGFRRSKTAKDQAFQPATDTAIKIDSMGRIVLAGGAAVGLGALCYYGLGMSNEMGAIEKAVIWPQYVKDRIHSTYLYFAGSVGLTALSAVAVSRTPALMGLMMRGSWLAIGATFAAMIGAGMLVRSISYEHSPMPKHLAWALHAGVMGAVIAPLTLLGGPLMVRAAWYTAGIVGGLSTVAMCAPSEKFLSMGGPLAVGFGVVFASSLGSMFLPPTSAFGAGLYSVAVYGGLVLFSLFLLYDTQKVIKRAETHPLYGVQKYDPINACMGIYMDTLNIFMRLVMILANGGGNRRK
uniref:Growth hormone inducible transmembrane protein n=1 Tax=Cyprinus carpio TaxID=7962 RepID=A0A8C1LHD3_CYPCA